MNSLIKNVFRSPRFPVGNFFIQGGWRQAENEREKSAAVAFLLMSCVTLGKRFLLAPPGCLRRLDRERFVNSLIFR
jgi:hypothetical protein